MKYNIKQLEKRIEIIEECIKEQNIINNKMVSFIEKIMKSETILLNYLYKFIKLKQGTSNGKNKKN